MSDSPDIALNGKPAKEGTLSKVGMSQIEAMVQIKTKDGLHKLPASMSLHVNVKDPLVKGIHMSRLYLTAQQKLSGSEFSFGLLGQVLGECLESHQEISDKAFLTIKHDYPIQHKALISENTGLRLYPVEHILKSDKDKVLSYQTSFTITYSSTCPCSAALARELIQQKFMQDFDENPNQQISIGEVKEWLGQESSILATPHGQRSEAFITVDWNVDQLQNVDFEALILEAEGVLKTPVQTAVKREDEQEFARLSGSNLMFAEDAARLLQDHYRTKPSIKGLHIKATHYESLHAHNAQAVASFGTLEI